MTTEEPVDAPTAPPPAEEPAPEPPWQDQLADLSRVAKEARDRMGLAEERAPAAPPIAQAMKPIAQAMPVRPKGALSVEEHAQRALAILADEQRLETRRMLAAALPGGYRFARFEAAGGELWLRRKPFSQRPKVIAKCRALARDPKTPGVVWAGAGGEGKTSLAVATAALWAEHHPGAGIVFLTSLKLAIARAQAPLGSGEPEIVERATRADLFVLDDLGTEREVPMSPIPDILHERAEQGRPTWVTTWCTSDELTTRYGGGIARRLLERSIVLTWSDG